MYPVVEKFVSINGEGPFAGTLSAFIRMRGCNLSCSYCDTAWAMEQDAPCEFLSEQDLLSFLEEEGIRRVTLTGGEPLLVPGIMKLIQTLGSAGYLVEIETNGSVDIRPFSSICPRPFFTLDYKCPGSNMTDAMRTDHYEVLHLCDSVKFVVSDITDLAFAYTVCQKHNLEERCQVFLSPVFGRINPVEIVEFMKQKKWNGARLAMQLHKIIWPSETRGV